MDITDDSLSYVDHALFEKVIDFICASFDSKDRREDIVLGTIFKDVFHMFNAPQNGDSEAYKFQMMITAAWDLLKSLA